MKRIVIIIMLFILFASKSVYSNDLLHYNKLYDFKILDENVLSENDVISREQCLTAIMKTIGVTDKDIESLKGSDRYAFADVSAYSYIGCAYYAKIAYGEERTINYSTYRTSHTGKNTDIFFEPNRCATIKDCLAFCVRCLDDNIISNDDLIKKAIKYGFINDSEIININNPLKASKFCDILTKLLNQKRYKYYTKPFVIEGYIDLDRTMRYCDMFS